MPALPMILRLAHSTLVLQSTGCVLAALARRYAQTVRTTRGRLRRAPNGNGNCTALNGNTPKAKTSASFLGVQQSV